MALLLWALDSTNPYPTTEFMSHIELNFPLVPEYLNLKKTCQNMCARALLTSH